MPQNRKFKIQDDYTWTDFRANLRRLLDSHGLNCKEFADAAGFNPTTVSRYLTTRSPDLTSIWRIADYWGVSIDWLLGRKVDDTTSYISDDAKKAAMLYSAATPEDRRIIDMMLQKYDHEAKRD